MTNLICIVCPKGCHLAVDEEKGDAVAGLHLQDRASRLLAGGVLGGGGAGPPAFGGDGRARSGWKRGG